MKNITWITVLLALAAVNVAMFVGDTDRWYNMAAALMAAGAAGFRMVFRPEC
jgi:lipoprotein signal peptidase